MRRAFILSVVLAICVSGLPPIWQSKQLPRCCTQQHGCSMAKRAAAQCAFATCDPEDAVTPLKMPLAIASATVICGIPQIESGLVMLGSRLQIAQRSADIDHPPRPLVA